MTNEQYDQAVTFWERKSAGEKKCDRTALYKWIDGFLSSHKVLALATGTNDFIRCTPLEYSWHDNALWIFTEGGLKFKALRENRHVSAAVFDADVSLNSLKSLQIEAIVEMVEPFSEEYNNAVKSMKISLEALQKLAEPMWLLKIIPSEITCLNSDFKKNGFGSRQMWKTDKGTGNERENKHK